MSRSLQLLCVALAFGVCGALATTPFVARAEEGFVATQALVVAAAVAAATVATTLWAAFVRPEAPAWHGTLVGAFSGLLAHPLMWLGLFIVIGNEVGGSVTSRASGTVLGSVLFGFFSAFFYGPITVPAGAICGWGLGRLFGTRPTGTP